MTKQSLIDAAGARVFQAAAKRAWERADGILRSDAGSGNDSYATEDYQLFSRLVDALMVHAGTTPDKMRIFFEIYREAPAFTLVDHLFVHHWADLDRKAKLAFWSEALLILAGRNDRLAAPIEYVLWCDFFEDPRTVAESWAYVTGPGANDRLLERVLIMSGPVPYGLKRPVYERLLGETRWHYFIFRSLLHSAHDVYGSIDVADARRVYEKLRLSLETEHRGALEAKLSSGV